MHNLKQFQCFDWKSFINGKDFTVIGCREWKDYNTHEVLGTRVEVAITRDETEYRPYNNEIRTNLMEKLDFKVKNAVDIPCNAKVLPVNPVVTAYGRDRDGNFTNTFANCLSVQCDDVTVL